MLAQRSKVGGRARRTRLGAVLGMLASTLCLGALFAAPATAWKAYVVINVDGEVAVIDTATNQPLGEPFSATVPVPQKIAITPDGRRLFLSHSGGEKVTVLDAASGQPVGSPIAVGEAPAGIAITPDGRFAYVANNNSGTVSVIDIASHQVTATIDGFQNCPDIVITPDGKFAYVSDAGFDRVSVIDVATNQVVGSPIPVGNEPSALAMDPGGKRVYVANSGSASVSAIDTGTRATVGAPVPVGSLPTAIAVSPDGATLYVSNFASANVSVIDAVALTQKTSISTGLLPDGLAISPDGRTAYVAESVPQLVGVIDTATNTRTQGVSGLGSTPEDVVISPDQPPVAAFVASPVARPGLPVAFDASASSDPDGTIASYAWSFGDGADGAGPIASHVYPAPGTYPVTLTLADESGCSTRQIYDGHGALCNGGPGAALKRDVTVAYPTVPVSCPKRATKRGCKVKVATVSRKRRKGKAKPRLVFETKVAAVKLKRGESRRVPVVPKAAYRQKFAAPVKVLVREVRDFKTRSGSVHTVKQRRKLAI